METTREAGAYENSTAGSFGQHGLMQLTDSVSQQALKIEMDATP